MHLAGFIEALSKAAGAEEVFDLICGTSAPLGYEKIGFFALTPEAEQAIEMATGQDSPIVVSNYPNAFTSAYRRTKRHEIDPVFPLARDTIAPLVWSDIVAGKSISDQLKALVGERLEAGIHDEVTCPVHGPRGQTFALRFARGGPGACDRTQLGTLQVLAIHFHCAFVRYLGVVAARPIAAEGLSDAAQQALRIERMLSQREQEVMLWTARGKSASSISAILNLTESTVNSYVRNAMRKLGTTNRVVAVVTAVRSGLIQP